MPIISERFDNLGLDGKPVRLGIMGGTFDPIHMAHLAFAEQARQGGSLDAVLFVPAGTPVFKLDRNVTPAEDRLAMCRLAVASNPHFDVSSIEIDRGGLTYTADTLRQLRAHYPENVTFCLITGSDTAASILKWRESAQVANLCELVVGQRPGANISPDAQASIKAAGFKLNLVEVSALDVSSSDLRSRISAGKSPRYLTANAVVDYISSHGLYRNDEEEQGSEPVAKEPTRAEASASDSDVLSKEFFEARKAELQTRVKPKRFKHSLGVSKTAVKMAKAYGVDVDLAALAGLLHDWDKGYDDAGIINRVHELGLQDDLQSYLCMPHLLHGPTAAVALKRRFPELPDDLIHAIAVHTSGCENMSDLDMIIYVADAIEPSRDYPAVEELRDMVGKAELEDLFLATFVHVLDNLVSRRKLIHPDAVKVWNHYVERARARAKR